MYDFCFNILNLMYFLKYIEENKKNACNANKKRT